MKKTLLVLLVTAFLLTTFSGLAFAEPRKGIPDGNIKVADLLVVGKETSNTSNINEVMYTLKVKITNTGRRPLHTNNNHVWLVDSSGKRYRVNRLCNPQPITIKPGESAVAERIFINVPKNVTVQKVILFDGGKLMGETNI